MSEHILGDGSDSVHVNKRPRRNPAPATKLRDENNFERAALPFQQKSVDDYRAACDAEDAATSNLENPDTTSHATSPTGTTSQIQDATSSPPPSDRAKDKRQIFEVDTSDYSDSAPDSRAKLTGRRPLKKKGM
jgi:hypothetical protein